MSAQGQGGAKHTSAEEAGIAFEQLKANGKIVLDEDGARWAGDVSSALDAAEDECNALADALEEAVRLNCGGESGSICEDCRRAIKYVPGVNPHGLGCWWKHPVDSWIATLRKAGPGRKTVCKLDGANPDAPANAELFTLAADHALLLRALVSRAAHFVHRESPYRPLPLIVWVQLGDGTEPEHSVQLDAAGCPILTEELRTALCKAVGL